MQAARGRSKTKLNERRVYALIRKIRKALRLPKSRYFSVSFVSKKRIEELNRRYFDKDRPTDVIAVGYKGKKTPGEIYSGYLGDIIICTDAARRNSKIYKTAFISEVSLYIVHGVLHLLGYDDATKRAGDRMRKKEKEVLKRL